MIAGPEVSRVVEEFHKELDYFACKTNAKQKQPGCKKSARPIRSHNGYKRPKPLISRN